MPVIACPGCGKQYNLPASAAGQVATCKCGKRFRLGGGSSGSTSAKSSKVPSAASKPGVTKSSKPSVVAAASKPKVQEAPGPAQLDDDFWNDALGSSEPVKEAVGAASKSAGTGPSPSMGVNQLASTSSYSSASKPAEPPKKKKKKSSSGVSWGADWGKFFGGLLVFLICAGLEYALFTSSGRISIYLVVAGVGGLFTAINGLMGADGIW